MNKFDNEIARIDELIATANRLLDSNISESIENISMLDIYSKVKQGIELNRNELIYLYDIYNDYFLEDNRDTELAFEILTYRNREQDLAKIFNCTMDNIEFHSEFLKKNTIVLLNDLDDLYCHNLSMFSKLRYIHYSAQFGYFHKYRKLPSLEAIGGDLTIYTDKIGNLDSLRFVGGYAAFEFLETIEGLESLEYVDGCLYAPKLNEQDTKTLRKRLGK